VHFGGKSSTGEFLTYFCSFSLLLVLSHLKFTCRKSIRKKWLNNTVKASTGRTSPLTVGPSMPTEAEKHMDGEIDAVFCLTL
jgi:hypothetical protein